MSVDSKVERTYCHTCMIHTLDTHTHRPTRTTRGVGDLGAGEESGGDVFTPPPQGACVSCAILSVGQAVCFEMGSWFRQAGSRYALTVTNASC